MPLPLRTAVAAQGARAGAADRQDLGVHKGKVNDDGLRPRLIINGFFASAALR